MELARLAGFASLALVGTMSLFWAMRGTLIEFVYPRDQSVQGTATVVGVVLMTGWLSSILPSLVSVPGTTPNEAASMFALSGVSFAVVLRIYGFTRTFASATKAREALASAELFLVCIALAFGFVILLAGIGDLGGYVRGVAGQDFSNRQPQGVVLLVGTIVELGIADAIWWIWRKLPESNAAAEKIVAEATREITSHPLGLLAMQIHLSISRAPSVRLPADVAHWFRTRASRDDVDECLGLLISQGFLLHVVAGSVRRNPHFVTVQRAAAERTVETAPGTLRLTIDETEAFLMTARGTRLRVVPPALRGQLDPLAVSGRALELAAVELVEKCIADIEKSPLDSRESLMLSYLKLRYLEGKTVGEIGSRLGYTREHVTRLLYRPSLELFRGWLLRRVALSHSRPIIRPVSRKRVRH